MILQALFATIGDLAVGFVVALLLAFTFWLIRGESKAAREEGWVEPESEYKDPWAGLPPKWRPPNAKADFKSERDAA